MTTPYIDAAIRAGCNADGRGICQWPTCESGIGLSCRNAGIITAALRTAIPREPSAEWIEATAEAIMIAAGFVRGMTWEKLPSKLRYLEIALAAYRARPIWQELWGGIDG